MTIVGVVRIGGAWVLTANGRRWGNFAYKVDAEEAALRLAKRAGPNAAVVLVPDDCGEMGVLNVA